MSYFHSWMNSTALANEIHYMKHCTFRLHNVSGDNVLPQSRKVRARGGGREEKVFGGVKRSVTAFRHV